MDDYEARCTRAATAQGLDPLAAALTAAGVEFHVAQTGGFCMVLAARTPLGTFAMIHEGLPLVVWQTDAQWDGDGTADTDEPLGDWTTSPEGFARFATILATIQTNETAEEPSAAVVEFVGLDSTGRENGPHDWSAVLDAAMPAAPDAD